MFYILLHGKQLSDQRADNLGHWPHHESRVESMKCAGKAHKQGSLGIGEGMKDKERQKSSFGEAIL